MLIAAAILATAPITPAAEYSPGRTPAKANVFTCSPKQLRSSDKLVVRASVPHGTELGIRTPTNEFVFVYSCDASGRAPQWRDVGCEGFAALSRFTIDLATFEASSVGPQGKKRRVFSQPGAYTILLGQNLETENSAQTVNRCNVHFTPKATAAP
jgi:hypothetical protein